MENVRAERSAGWSALAYVGVLFVATLLTTGMPAIDVRPADAALTIDEHRTAYLLGGWLRFLRPAFSYGFLPDYARICVTPLGGKKAFLLSQFFRAW